MVIRNQNSLIKDIISYTITLLKKIRVITVITSAINCLAIILNPFINILQQLQPRS